MEDLELTAAKDVPQIDESHTKTTIGFVAAKTIDGLMISQPREWRWNIDRASGFEDCSQHALRQRINVVRCNKRRFDVDLSKLRLAVRPQVFVAKRLRNLKVLLHPGDHEELLVLLWRLGQGIKLSRH